MEKDKKKRFTFADAKARIKELEMELGDKILDTKDNIFTDEELRRIRNMEWMLPASIGLNAILSAIAILG